MYSRYEIFRVWLCHLSFHAVERFPTRSRAGFRSALGAMHRSALRSCSMQRSMPLFCLFSSNSIDMILLEQIYLLSGFALHFQA